MANEMKIMIILFVVLLLAITGCAQKKIVLASQARGDFAEDTRDPKAVCGAMHLAEKCTLLEYKIANNDEECPGGRSPAGCFSCRFEC